MKEKNLSPHTLMLFTIISGLLSCKSPVYQKLSINELKEIEINGQVESIIIDYEKKYQLILNVRNRNKYISLPTYSIWAEDKYIDGVPCQKALTKYVCRQGHADQYDSLIKLAGSMAIEVKKDGGGDIDTIWIVSIDQAKRGIAEDQKYQFYQDSINREKGNWYR